MEYRSVDLDAIRELSIRDGAVVRPLENFGIVFGCFIYDGNSRTASYYSLDREVPVAEDISRKIAEMEIEIE